MQPFALTAATTSSCSTQRGSVPETSTPSSWKWPMTKYDLWPHWRLLNRAGFLSLSLSLFFCLKFCFCFLLLLEGRKAGRKQTGCCTCHLDGLSWGASGSKGRRTNLEKLDRWLVGVLREKRCWLSLKNQLRRGSLYLWTDLEPIFRTSSRWWTKDCF